MFSAPRKRRSSKCGRRRLAPKPRMSYMPSRAARWISAMVCSDRRERTREGPRGGDPSPLPSVRAGVVDLEVCRAGVPSRSAEVGWRVGVETRLLRVVGNLHHVLVSHLLLDAVGPEPGHRAPHVKARLVDRVAEGVSGVLADDQAPVCAMNALIWPTEPPTTMSIPFIEIPQRGKHRRGRRAAHPAPSRPPTGSHCRRRSLARHHVLGDPVLGVAVTRTVASLFIPAQ